MCEYMLHNINGETGTASGTSTGTTPSTGDTAETTAAGLEVTGT